ncbi:hypothetical protein LP420_08185 [Massilia sp. B-10]|nr:hypothetical protein LP420_08185 [Massilia sp. B-10]
MDRQPGLGLERWRIGTPDAQRQRFGAAHGYKPGWISVLYQDTDSTIWA